MSKPAGLYVFHNTIISENTNAQTFSNAHFRNNLFMGTGKSGRPVATFPNATAYSTSDYNGYRPNPADNNFRWVSPSGKLRDYSITMNEEGEAFSSLEQFAAASGLDKHSMVVDYDIFESLQPPDPEKPSRIYHAVDFNFSLSPTGEAVDAGLHLPNVNDDFRGDAPDLGAREAGSEEPVYGPRGDVFNRPFYR
jgi:hypothetical protein